MIATPSETSLTNFHQAPDFSRFARKPSDAFLPQLLTIPIGFGITSFIGIFVGSASAIIYPSLGATWNPLDLLKEFITDGSNGVGSSGDRAGTFFIAAAFVLAQLGTNIAANSISAGTDMTALLPRYINIRRGGYVCCVIGIVICPWQFLTSSSNFTTYLSAYSVFLSSIAGPMIADYYVVRKGYYELHNLYSADARGPYYGVYGFQWRGWAGYISGILINVVGFAGACGVAVPKGATYIYNINFFAGFLVSAGVYIALCTIWPVPATSPTGAWLEVHDVVETDATLIAGKDAGDAYAPRDDEVESGTKAGFRKRMADISHAL